MKKKQMFRLREYGWGVTPQTRGGVLSGGGSGTNFDCGISCIKWFSCSQFNADIANCFGDDLAVYLRDCSVYFCCLVFKKI